MAMFLITGGLLNAVQTTMYALAAHVYPTEIRSTGVGTAVAFGRVGNVLAVYVGGFALDRGGTAGYFLSWAVLMALVFVQNGKMWPMTKAIQNLLSQYGTEWHLLAAGAFILMAVPLIVFFALQRYFVQGLLAGSVK